MYRIFYIYKRFRGGEKNIKPIHLRLTLLLNLTKIYRIFYIYKRFSGYEKKITPQGYKV